MALPIPAEEGPAPPGNPLEFVLEFPPPGGSHPAFPET